MAMSDNDMIRNWKRSLHHLFKIYSVHYEVNPAPYNRGENYKFVTSEACMIITIGDEWVGYELEVKKEATGSRSVVVFLDSDNYPLDGTHRKQAEEIFTEALNCTKALLEGKIYAGTIAGKAMLAVQLTDSTYKVVMNGRFISSQKIVPVAELQYLKDLKAVK